MFLMQTAMRHDREAKCGVRGSAGLTVIELLVASAVLVGVLLSFALLFSQSTRVYRLSSNVADAEQALSIAAQLVRSDVALAGSRCIDASAATRVFTQDTIAVTANGAFGDQLLVRYYDDISRFGVAGASCQIRTVALRAGLDADGAPALLRAEVSGEGVPSAGAFVPALSGVTVFGVSRVVDVNGKDAAPGTAAEIAAVQVRIVFGATDGELRFAVGLPNRQRL